MRHVFMAATALATLAACTTAAAQDRNDKSNKGDKGDRDQQRNAFQWSGDLARGQRLYVYNINGNISVQPARGGKVEITADKTWRRGRPEDVTIQAHRVRGDRDVVVCAAWNDPNAECDENGMQSHNRDRDRNNHNDVQVDFTIRLPAGAHVTANTVNGDLEITGGSGDVSASTVNGRIDAESSDGTVEAKTVNGNIDVQLGRLPSRGVSYETVTGSITLELPDGTNADVEANTVMGKITSDFPITIGGSDSRRDGFSSRTLRGTIGRGGPRIELKTVMGPIRLQKSGRAR